MIDVSGDVSKDPWVKEASFSANAINNKGVVTGTYSLPFQYAGFFYNDGTPHYFPELINYGDGPAAAGINDAQAIVGTFTQADSRSNGFIYKNGNISVLDKNPASTMSAASAINNTGDVVGAHSTQGGNYYRHAYLWKFNGNTLDLGTFPGGNWSTAWAINSSGTIVGWSNGGSFGYRAFLYDGSLHNLGILKANNQPDGGESEAYAINSAGVVVGYSTSGFLNHAFIYSNGIMTDLNSLIPADSSIVLSGARGINDAGQIAATGTTKDGSIHAFLLTPAFTSISAANLKMVGVTSSDTEYPVEGIVCDNLQGLSEEKKSHIKITLPNYPDAEITASQLSGPNQGYLKVNLGELDYYPPDEYNSNPNPQSVTEIDRSATRKITLTVRFRSMGKDYIIAPTDITLGRPPVVLVHGINNDPSNWNPFIRAISGLDTAGNEGVDNPALASVPFVAVNHNDPKSSTVKLLNGNGPVEYAAYLLSYRIRDAIVSVRNGYDLSDRDTNSFDPNKSLDTNEIHTFSGYAGKHLACNRVDVVAWSYGGVITRWYIASDGTNPSVPNTPGKSWYQRPYGITSPDVPKYQGDIRKVITLGSMWRGVPLINYANEIAFRSPLLPPVFPSEMLPASTEPALPP